MNDAALSVTTRAVDRRELTYWTLQIGGWGSYSVLGLILASQRMGRGLQPALIVGYALYFGYSIALTEALRRIARRRRWLDETIGRAWGRMIAGGLFVGLIQTACIIGINVVLEGRATPFRHASQVLYVALGTSLAAMMWSVYYLQLTMGRRRREKEVQLQLSLREAELSALEAQVNPHFLFNALNSIRGLVAEDPALAQDMITRLSNLLRYNLRHDLHHTVPLAAELEIVSDYLALETMRFDERLRVDVAVAPRARTVAVPSMVLQTLVENAVKYGIAPLASGGDLAIRGDIDGDRLVLDVENTGRLADPDPEATQVGLANARERLRILYGDHAQLDLAERNGRVVATLRIPVSQ
ncbi:MAG: sensor histidine kinase [Vicinamibacterales bacterium]